MKLILFGPHVMLFPQEVIANQAVDVVIVGEPEVVFSAWSDELESVPGIWYKKNDLVWRNDKVPVLEDLDSLPFPAWDLLPVFRYDALGMLGSRAPFVLVLASRGCPHGCNYCPYPIVQGRKRRIRSVQNVIAELEWLNGEIGIRAVLFRDPEFALDRNWTYALCDEISNRTIDIVWRCETRIENLDDKLIQAMAAAGCIGINIGIESGDRKIVSHMGRRFVEFKRSRAIIDICRKYGIETFCFFMIGFPNETLWSAARTILYAVRLFPDHVQFSVVTPYPGTPLAAMVRAQGFQVSCDMARATGYCSMMRSEKLSAAAIQCIQSWAEWLWHLRKNHLSFYTVRQLFRLVVALVRPRSI